MYRQQLTRLICLAVFAGACGGAPKRPEIRWRGVEASDSTIEIEFGRGQNGSDLLLSLFERVAKEKDLVITEIAIHFIWDTTRLIECTSHVLPKRSVQESSMDASQETQSWIALRRETHEVSEEDHICRTVSKQVILIGDREEVCSPTTPSACAEDNDNGRRRESKTSAPTPFNAVLATTKSCSLEPVQRVVTRYLYEFYEKWVPPNWVYLATRFKSPRLTLGPPTCTPIANPSSRSLSHRLVARVRRNGH
tara:strand:- start:361 stop:1113 length:753 start_codon:yes stop_codon:yes gene_type:complete